MAMPLISIATDDEELDASMNANHSHDELTN